MNKLFQTLFYGGAVLLLSGCLSPTPPTLPSPPKEEQHIEPWWTEFHDESLNQLVTAALHENLTLQSAQQRVLQAYATLHVKEAANLPSVTLSSTATLQDEIKGVNAQSEAYKATLSASYEADLFGARSHAIDAQKASYLASYEAMQVSGISLVAELSNAWYTLAYKKESLALLEEQFDVAYKMLALTRLKHQSGTNSITDVWQQEQYIKNLEAQKITLQGDIQTQIRALNLLLGRSVLTDLPQTQNARLITIPPQPEVGIAATKLLHRPDVKQAFYTLKSANEALGEAVANQYPTLNLSLSSIAGSSHFSTLLDTIIGSAVASLSGTIFDAGAKEAQVKKSLFSANEYALAYKATLLEAFSEVQDALEAEKTQTQYLNHLDQRVHFAKIIYERQKAKYAYGIETYLSVLNAQQSLQELEQTRLLKRLNLISERIALHRALAGGLFYYDVKQAWRDYEN
jgi:NodT family efflux transporter outer membrane factor (OMF) lipoprotein